MDFQRARSPERKEQRRQAILDAAAQVLDRDGIEATSLNAIAREAGIVKSALYRYFESREEIFLRLMLQDLRDLTDSLAATVHGPVPTSTLATVMATGFAARPRLCTFISQLAMTLERNVTGAVLRDIKLALLDEGNRAAKVVGRALPEIPAAACQQAVQIAFCLVAGHWPMANPTGELDRLLQEAVFQPFRHDFEDFMKTALVTLFAGLAKEAAPA
ncbi:MAG: TetR family transcriptional regulator [Pseudomonadota bacterium]